MKGRFLIKEIYAGICCIRILSFRTHGFWGNFIKMSYMQSSFYGRNPKLQVSTSVKVELSIHRIITVLPRFIEISWLLPGGKTVNTLGTQPRHNRSSDMIHDKNILMELIWPFCPCLDSHTTITRIKSLGYAKPSLSGEESAVSSASSVQGDHHSRCSQLPVDTKKKFAYQYMGNILKQNFCFGWLGTTRMVTLYIHLSVHLDIPQRRERERHLHFKRWNYPFPP